MFTITATPVCDCCDDVLEFCDFASFEAKAKHEVFLYDFEISNDADETQEFLFNKFFNSKNPDLSKKTNINNFFEATYEHVDLLEDNFIAIEFLLDEGSTIVQALDEYEDLIIFEGKSEDYAYDYIQGTGELDSLGSLAYYFDYKMLARDMEINGEISPFSSKFKDYIIVRG